MAKLHIWKAFFCKGKKDLILALQSSIGQDVYDKLSIMINAFDPEQYEKSHSKYVSSYYYFCVVLFTVYAERVSEANQVWLIKS